MTGLAIAMARMVFWTFAVIAAVDAALVLLRSRADVALFFVFLTGAAAVHLGTRAALARRARR